MFNKYTVTRRVRRRRELPIDDGRRTRVRYDSFVRVFVIKQLTYNYICICSYERYIFCLKYMDLIQIFIVIVNLTENRNI